MKPFSLGPLQESQSHLRQEFLTFANQWQATKATWQDAPARQFEQRFLRELSPTLSRVAQAADAFAEAVRHADRVLADPDRESGEL